MDTNFVISPKPVPDVGSKVNRMFLDLNSTAAKKFSKIIDEVVSNGLQSGLGGGHY